MFTLSARKKPKCNKWIRVSHHWICRTVLDWDCKTKTSYRSCRSFYLVPNSYIGPALKMQLGWTSMITGKEKHGTLPGGDSFIRLCWMIMKRRSCRQQHWTNAQKGHFVNAKKRLFTSDRVWWIKTFGVSRAPTHAYLANRIHSITVTSFCMNCACLDIQFVGFFSRLVNAPGSKVCTLNIRPALSNGHFCKNYFSLRQF